MKDVYHRKRDTLAECFTVLTRILELKHFDEITISELCVETGITRATFYRRIEGKEDLLERGTLNVIDLIARRLPTLSGWNEAAIAEIAREFYGQLESFRPEVSSIFGNNAPSWIRATLQRELSHVCYDLFFSKTSQGLSEADRVLNSKFLADIFLNSMQEWLTDESLKSSDEYVLMITHFILGGIHGFSIPGHEHEG